MLIPARLAAWGNVALALTGPTVVAAIGAHAPPSVPTLAAHGIGVAAIALLAVAVTMRAVLGEGYAWRRLGFGNVSVATPLLALGLTAFFVFLFGPAANLVLAQLGGQDFTGAIAAANRLPSLYLTSTIVIVAAAEEVLYRGYAIERLFDLTGSYPVASIVSVIAFAVAHVPVWGVAPAATMIAAGGILAAVYLWCRDLVALILAHIATDVCGIVLAPLLAHAATRT